MDISQQFAQESLNQLARVQKMYDDLFYTTSKGEKKIQPNVRIEDVKAIKATLSKLSAIYKEVEDDSEALIQERNEADFKMDSTRKNLIDSKDGAKIKLPKFIRDLYGLNE